MLHSPRALLAAISTIALASYAGCTARVGYQQLSDSGSTRDGDSYAATGGDGIGNGDSHQGDPNGADTGDAFSGGDDHGDPFEGDPNGGADPGDALAGGDSEPPTDKDQIETTVLPATSNIRLWCMYAEDLTNAADYGNGVASGPGAQFVRAPTRNSFALDLDGNDCVSYAYDAATLNFRPSDNFFTMALWFNTSSAGAQTIYDHRALANRDNHQLDMVDGLITLRFSTDYTAGGCETVLTHATALNDGQWHHVAVNRTGLRMAELYVDGQLVDEDIENAGCGAVGLDPSSPLYIGGDWQGNCSFQGQIDSVYFQIGQYFLPADIGLLYTGT